MENARAVGLSAIMLVLLVTSANAEGLEHPYFRQWASFRAGSSVTLEGRIEDGSNVSTFKQTITLTEVANDYAMIEIVRNEETRAQVVKKQKVDRLLKKYDKMVYRGREEIILAGKRFTCERYANVIFNDSGKEMMAFDYWFHPDIPGPAKIESKSTYGGGMSTIIQTAVAWEKK